MQNKKSLLHRMLVIYITFFIVLLVGIGHSFLPNLSKGYHEGKRMGLNIATSDKPIQIFMLGEVPLTERIAYPIEGQDSTAKYQITSYLRHLDITVSKPDDQGSSPVKLAFQAIGGSAWIYIMVMLIGLSSLAIIVLMFVIIRSIRRSIKEECTLDPRNIWLIRIIGVLTIFAELSQDFVNWLMTRQAAELLAGSSVTVDTTFTTSYSTIIMGILIIFTAEVFAIGQNLSEEQKLTI